MKTKIKEHKCNQIKRKKNLRRTMISRAMIILKRKLVLMTQKFYRASSVILYYKHFSTGTYTFFFPQEVVHNCKNMIFESLTSLQMTMKLL